MSAVPNTERIRKALQNAIVAGDDFPGVMLDREELAHKYEVSRTPIREALQQPKASGLVRVVPKRSTCRQKIEADDVDGY